MGWCMGQWVGSGQMTNLIKLELINIIWFCLKIYNLSRHPYLWVDGWVNGWAHVKPLKSNKSWPNWDNSIMDILDILLDILLKPPQPFIGLFFDADPCAAVAFLFRTIGSSTTPVSTGNGSCDTGEVSPTPDWNCTVEAIKALARMCMHICCTAPFICMFCGRQLATFFTSC